MTYSLALVTGATSGIGEALAHALAHRGIPLLLTGRNQEALQALHAHLSPLVPVHTLPCDLQDPTSRSHLLQSIRERTPDLIINNAGLGYFGNALTYPTADHLEVIRVNNEALLEITLEAARHLKNQHRPGTILNVSSIAAFFPFPFHAVYAASKAFVNHFSLAFDTEMRPHGIRILAACPGLVTSNFRTRCTKGKASSENPIGYMPTPYAAAQILKQIDKLKPLHIFNTRSHLLSLLARCIPRSLLYRSMLDHYHDLWKD